MLFLLLGLFGGCGPESLALPLPDDLPDRVVFRTETETFNRDWFLAVRDGRIWFKPNTDNLSSDDDWALLGATGLPEGNDLVRFDPPEQIVEISADGIHLVAISDEGVFYRGTNLQKNIRKHMHWTDAWGWPRARGDGLTTEFSTERGWDMADSHHFNVRNYEDRLGVKHWVGLGVAHTYRLAPDGRSLYFNDFWLPADWSREICLPERGTIEALNLSVSASTLFIIDTAGALYTRLYDFDTAGENTLLTFSYIIDGPSGSTRALPAEPWSQQPSPEGDVTKRITIFQDGRGNAARQLRVEGVLDGQTGFFHKAIFDEDWQFEATGEPLSAPLVQDLATPETEPPPRGQHLVAQLGREDSDTVFELDLPDFDVVCSPVEARLLLDGEPVGASGRPLVLELHHAMTLVEEIRPIGFYDQGIGAELNAALLLPESWDQIDDEDHRQIAQEFFEDRSVINFFGTATSDGLDLAEMPRSLNFRVPRAEKGKRGELYEMRTPEPGPPAP